MTSMILIACVLVAGVGGLEINNRILGDPEIECGPTSLSVNLNTQNEFEGHVYVKGLYAREECRSDDGGKRAAGISLEFNSCGVSRTRSLNPRGVFVSVVVIVSFHPLFVTKVDRAFRVQCFYMEADKTVDTGLQVSLLTTEFVTQQVAMPTCRYEVLDSPTGDVVRFATVGQKVFHKWSCDTETVDTFCMIVRSCFVDDSVGDKVDLVDEYGCAKDRFLLNNLEYQSDLMAGVDSMVFKYADRPQLAFQCQITLLVKEPNDQCPRPFCPIPAGRGAGGQNLRTEDAGMPPKHPFPLLEGSPYLPTNGKRFLARKDAKPSTTIGYEPISSVPPPIQRYRAGPPAARFPAPVRPLELRYARRRYRRNSSSTREAGVLDVRAEMTTFDVTETIPEVPHEPRPGFSMAKEGSHQRASQKSEEVCMPSVLFGVFVCLAGFLLISAISFCVFLISQNLRKDQIDPTRLK